MSGRLRLWIAICIFAVHAWLVFGLAGPDSRAANLCIILGELTASLACFQAAVKTSREARVHWILLGTSILFAPLAATLFPPSEIIGDAESSSARDLLILLKACYGASLLLSVSLICESRVGRAIRVMSVALSLAAGGLIIYMAQSALSIRDSSRFDDLLFFARMIVTVGGFIAVIATLRILGSDQQEVRKFFFSASAFLWSIVFLPLLRIDLLARFQASGSVLLILPPYLLLFALAGQPPPGLDPEWKPPAVAFAVVRHAGAFVLFLGLLLIGLVISRLHFKVGSAAVVVAVLCYCLFNIIVRSQCVRMGQALREANEKLGALAEIDGLTGIANRRVFDERLPSELASAQRSGLPLSLLMIDVDYFKAFNDSKGHLAGDSCLVQVAQALGNTLPRATDLVARYGGEEFAVLLPSTATAGAVRVAELLREAVANLRLEHPTTATRVVTVSIGASTSDMADNSSSTALVEAADQALYRAKQLGRNRTESHVIGEETYGKAREVRSQ